MPRRSGKSLIELVAVIGALAVIFAVAFQTLHMLLRAERLGTRALAVGLAQTRASRQFRADAHAARRAERGSSDDAAPAPLHLDLMDGTTVTWTVADDEIIRTTERNGETTASERYRVAPGPHDLGFAQDGTVAVLTLRPTAAPPRMANADAVSGRPRELRTEAVVGRDHRFATVETPDPKGGE